MRKLNLILVLLILVCFVLHAVFAVPALCGAAYIPQKPIARACLTFVLLHAVTSTVLLAKTVSVRLRGGVGYFRENGAFWARRISGFLMLIPLALHLVTFIGGGAFGAGKLVIQVALVITVALHVVLNALPWLTSLGVRRTKRALLFIRVAFSALALFLTAAFFVYYFSLLD